MVDNISTFSSKFLLFWVLESGVGRVFLLMAYKIPRLVGRNVVCSGGLWWSVSCVAVNAYHVTLWVPWMLVRGSREDVSLYSYRIGYLYDCFPRFSVRLVTYCYVPFIFINRAFRA
jgi:hypothetical protein